MLESQTEALSFSVALAPTVLLSVIVLLMSVILYIHGKKLKEQEEKNLSEHRNFGKSLRNFAKFLRQMDGTSQSLESQVKDIRRIVETKIVPVLGDSEMRKLSEKLKDAERKIATERRLSMELARRMEESPVEDRESNTVNSQSRNSKTRKRYLPQGTYRQGRSMKEMDSPSQSLSEEDDM